MSISQTKWVSRLAAAAVWLLAGASIFYWVNRLALISNTPSAFGAPKAWTPPQDKNNSVAVAKLLGARSPEASNPLVPSLSSRFLLLGVLAYESGAGAALVAVDGKPAKAFRVGAEISPDYEIASVKQRSATVVRRSDRSTALTLEMSALKTK